ncbi:MULTISPECIES: FAD-dependent monooxygenase [Arthrobacter]|uniref:FAD-dependent monooxygenase n=1 Tax=Arthrobacter caoxuetaonis TaxID=2886935 RepID=A0A9X1SD66_9MICC|nr:MULTISPECIES: FAD-dependent monooxygenase [Arthrobacter]MCC3283270.1 FAD-dependent monooxygenase [Arthrobacter caoxuetaonis]MCC3298392.1 FAD-dependent monooxygenase [Arthrobacter caoxuetaonis]MCC9195152.1 FAD-dependent monooxygenase [Arthrobacter sp. zg-Y916]USQ57592.1 FAD-dependent monooxygenase [Arthrobacter caoxuetaonis]
MAAVKTVGIVGSGAAGLTAASLLADAGVDVEILEKADAPSRHGSGITLQGNALRIFRQLGIWDEIAAKGFAFSELGFRAPDPAGTLLSVTDDARTGGSDLPATLGMYRPDLADTLRRRADEAGVRISYGKMIKGVEQDAGSVTAITDDGERLAYDLLIGADGLHSVVRPAIGIDVVPEPTGMGIWRAFVERPAEVVRTDLTYGGPCYIAGYCPTGRDSMYAYLVEDAQERSVEEGPKIMAELAAAYGGPWKEIRASLDHSARVNYTRFTSHLVDGPWNRGRAVIIGDAAHSCPPTIAQGAAMAVEDAAVLAELVVSRDELDDSLWAEFTERRLERARTVVQGSVQLGAWMLTGEIRNADVPGLIASVATTVSSPA